MHFKDDPISDRHAKYYLIIWCLKLFSGPSNLVPSFGPVFSGAVPSNTTTRSPPVIFIAGRPKAALLLWFFGDFSMWRVVICGYSRYI